MILRETYELIKDGSLDTNFFIKLCKNLIEAENNLYIVNKAIQLAISAIQNYLPQSFKENKKSSFSKYLTENIWKCFEGSLSKNLTNYIIDIINVNDKESVQFFLKNNLGYSDFLDDSSLNKSFVNYGFDEKTRSRISNLILTLAGNENSIPYIEDLTILNKTIHQVFQYRKNRNKEALDSLWNLLVFRDQNYSNQEIIALMKGFNFISKSFSSDLTKEFTIYWRKNFFNDLKYIVNNYPENYAILFYKYLNPAQFFVSKKILSRYIDLKNSIKENQHISHQKLRLLIEFDILEIKIKLIIEKTYSYVQLYNRLNNPLRRF